MLLFLLACADPSSPDAAGGPSPGDPETWLALPATCEVPADLPADPLVLEGQARVGQEAGSGFMEALDLDLEGDLAYVVGMGFFLVFDLSDPAAPRRLYGPAATSAGKLHRVEPLGDGYVATSDREDGLYVWDVSAPEDSRVVAEVPGWGMEGLHHEDGYLYVTVRGEGLRVYDLRDPASPVERARAPGLSSPWELAGTGDGWLYAADNALGVVPIDVSDPEAPAVGEPVDLGAAVLHVRFVEGSGGTGDRVYAAAGGAGVVVLDAEDRSAPVFVDAVTTGGSAVMSDVAEGRLWVADHEGIAVFDVADLSPVQAERTEQFALAVAARGDRAFVGDWNLFDVYRLDPEQEAGALDVPSDTVRIVDGTGEARITNRGAGALHLLGATVDDPDAVVRVDAATLQPGESATLRVEGLVASTSLCLASDDPDEPTRTLAVLDAALPPAGAPAPDFTLVDLDGNTHRLAEQLGHPVLLAYFATWCPVCPSEVSDIQATIASTYADEGLVVWAVATREPHEQVQRWAEDFGITLPVLLDEDGSVTALYEQTMAFPTAAYPQVWLVGTDGVIEYYSNSYEHDELVQLIERELAGG